MEKIVVDFFKNNQVSTSKDIPFEETDLFEYLFLAYGARPVFSENGFIKVVERDNSYIYSEHLFYDYYPNEDASYISIEGQEISSSKINNTQRGLELSKNGFSIASVNNKKTEATLLMMGALNFSPVSNPSNIEPYATFKFNPVIWQKPLEEKKNGLSEVFYNGIADCLNELVEFSDVLKSLNIFDLNVLEWKKGQEMKAHNGVDYKSFINLITYNTESSSCSRTIQFGEFDWSEVTVAALKSHDYESLMSIDYNNKELGEHLVDTKDMVLVNSFNPRFYHQVSEFLGDGSLFVCTANKSFQSVVNRFSFSW